MRRRASLLALPGLVLQPGVSRAVPGADQRPHFGRPAPLPPGYVAMGQRASVPPMILYGVALQESKQLWGPLALPWPWTLNNNAQRRAYRYRSYQEAVAALRGFLAAGQRNVDTCLMQVNWQYHASKLQTPERALDPYPNIWVGAQLLREHFAATRNWFTAVGHYHHPAGGPEADSYASAVYRRLQLVAQQAPRVGAGHG